MAKQQIQSTKSESTQSEDLLAQIMGKTETALEEITNAPVFDINSIVTQANESLSGRIDSRKLEGRQRDIAEKVEGIENATMENSCDVLQKQELSLRTYTNHVMLSAGAIDSQIKALQEPTQEELTKIAEIEAEVKQAEIDLGVAGQRNILFRGGAVRNANAQLETAKAALARTKAEVEEAVNYRMEHASISESVKTFLTIATRASAVMMAGANNMAKNAQLAEQTGIAAGNAKITLAEALTRIGHEIEAGEAAVNNGHEEVNNLVNDSPERAKKEQAVRLLENRLVDLRGQHNVILDALGKTEQEINFFKTLHDACLQLKANYLAIKAELDITIKHNTVGWNTAIEAMKSGRQLETGANISEATDRITEDLQAAVAQTNVAATRRIKERIASIPLMLEAQFKISNAHDEAIAQELQEIMDLAEQAKKNWPQIEKRLNFVDHPTTA